MGWLGAGQAQDYAGAKWALGLHLQGATDEDRIKSSSRYNVHQRQRHFANSRDRIMAAVLTYHLRWGLLTGIASGKYFHLPTQQDRSGVTAWGKDLELRPGKVSLFDHSGSSQTWWGQ